MNKSFLQSKKFIEAIVNEHQADSTRIGIMGISMGAITAGGIFADNLGVKCLVGINGTFAWQESIKRNYLPATTEDNKESIEHYDPMNNEDKIKERAILILHGTEDTSVPIESQRAFYNKMRPQYIKNPKRFEFIEESNVNHRVTTGMLQEAVRWFKEQL